MIHSTNPFSVMTISAAAKRFRQTKDGARFPFLIAAETFEEFIRVNRIKTFEEVWREGCC